MSKEEEIKGAIVEMLSISPGLVHASESLAYHSTKLVKFVQTIDPELSRAEATYVAATIIKSLPEQLTEDPEMLVELKRITQEFRDLRK